MGNWDGGHMDAGWGLLMMLGMLAFWVLVAAAVVWLVRTSRPAAPPAGGGASPAPPGAEDVLAERFARGEIDADEFRSRRDLLRSRH